MASNKARDIPMLESLQILTDSYATFLRAPAKNMRKLIALDTGRQWSFPEGILAQ